MTPSTLTRCRYVMSFSIFSLASARASSMSTSFLLRRAGYGTLDRMTRGSNSSSRLMNSARWLCRSWCRQLGTHDLGDDHGRHASPRGRSRVRTSSRIGGSEVAERRLDDVQLHRDPALVHCSLDLGPSSGSSAKNTARVSVAPASARSRWPARRVVAPPRRTPATSVRCGDERDAGRSSAGPRSGARTGTSVITTWGSSSSRSFSRKLVPLPQRTARGALRQLLGHHDRDEVARVPRDRPDVRRQRRSAAPFARVQHLELDVGRGRTASSARARSAGSSAGRTWTARKSLAGERPHVAERLGGRRVEPLDDDTTWFVVGVRGRDRRRVAGAARATRRVVAVDRVEHADDAAASPRSRSTRRRRTSCR